MSPRLEASEIGRPCTLGLQPKAPSVRRSHSTHLKHSATGEPILRLACCVLVIHLSRHPCSRGRIIRLLKNDPSLGRDGLFFPYQNPETANPVGVICFDMAASGWHAARSKHQVLQDATGG